MTVEHLRNIIAAQKSGRTVGIMSVCSANQFVLEAAMRQAETDDTILLVESTANQVNQFGGYSGMTPEDFVSFVGRIAGAMDFPRGKILLGGDHIGPGPWQSEPSETAMGHARDLVRACVAAGYEKLHLDTCMACIDDDIDDTMRLPAAVAVERSALLCKVAEETAANRPPARSRPVYVIGTDVPIPGGMHETQIPPWVSRVADVEYTVTATKKCFDLHHLESAWDRTIAIVVQPGVDFGPETVVAYKRDRAEALISYIKDDSKFVYEAHATDYQTGSALSEMVEDQLAILKVGPALTFSLREALTALAIIEEELLSERRGITLSNLRRVIERILKEDPKPWIKYYPAGLAEAGHARYYGFSDRIRYYWTRPEIQASIHRLLANLGVQAIPLPLISQYLPKQYDAIGEGRIQAAPRELIYSKIMEITSRYSAACHTIRE